MRAAPVRLLIAGGVALLGTLWLFHQLLPAGSFPIGWDVFWNLHVARTIAESGFPERIPQGAFTQFARDYADRQWLFHLVLAAVGGRELGPQHVPGLCQAFAAAKVVVVLLCALRLTGTRLIGSPALLLAGLSATALFRATALRDMLLAILPLLVLVASMARVDERARPGDRVCIFAATLVFTLAHGAVALPIAVGVLCCLGRRLDGRGYGWRTLLPLLAGILVGACARPNPLGSLELLFTLNVVMPWAAATGALPIQPTEFAALPFGQLLSGSWPLFALGGVCLAVACRQRRWWRLVLPAAALTAGSVFGARLVELAVPCTVLAALVQTADVRWRLPWLVELVTAVTAFGLAVLAADRAQPSLDANRFVVLEDVARELKRRARPDDVVFVADWGVTSPLTFFTRDVPLRFTGVTDPVLMLREAPEAFAAWWRIRSARDAQAAQTMRRVFDARFAVVGFADHQPGSPVGATAVRIWQSFGELERAGTAIRSADFPMPPLHATIEPGYRLYEFGR